MRFEGRAQRAHANQPPTAGVASLWLAVSKTIPTLIKSLMSRNARFKLSAELLIKDQLRTKLLHWFRNYTTPCLKEAHILELAQALNLHPDKTETVEVLLELLDEFVMQGFVDYDEGQWTLTMLGDSQAFGEPPWKQLRNTLGG